MKMPVLFIGHGSPMNAIATNRYSQTLNALGAKIPRPRAVLCISAHWMSEGTWVTHMPRPKTIHDFYGFPEELFAVQYPAPGAPEIAEEIARVSPGLKINLDDEMWGLDHGTWSVLRHVYPLADVPTIQLSLYMERAGDYHLKVGEALKPLREAGILILGSGNLVHNLKTIRWDERADPYPWARDCDLWLKEKIEARDVDALTRPLELGGEPARLSIPTWEHYYPFLYILGASEPTEKPVFEYESLDNGSISMRSVSYGL